MVIRAKAVILCMGAAGRLGLPASGYLFGTYENAANAGCGYAMAYHAGAELTNLECYQINPLIKDYNGPACAYVAGPFGAYTAARMNAEHGRNYDIQKLVKWVFARSNADASSATRAAFPSRS